MRKASYFRQTWDVVALVLAALLAAIAALWAVNAAGQEPSPPAMEFVVAPWEGMFSAGESPGGTPLVQVGSYVVPETVVGMIYLDVMQPARRIEVYAGVKGTILEVMVEDGSFVEAGQPLLRVQLDPPET